MCGLNSSLSPSLPSSLQTDGKYSLRVRLRVLSVSVGANAALVLRVCVGLLHICKPSGRDSF